MRQAGGWIATFGVIGALIALFMDVSVETGMGGRVNNIGLMADRQNYLISAALAVIVGVILIESDRTPATAKKVKPEKEKPLPYGITEQDGLFTWGGQGFPSRAEAESHVRQRLAAHASSVKRAI
jgi:hypothetical protein